MFKPSTSFIHVLFSEHLAFQFGFCAMHEHSSDSSTTKEHFQQLL
jgi:hypothetical protein